MTTRTCPTCGRALFSPDPQIPTTNDPYLLPQIPTKFRLPSGAAVQIVSITDDDETGTSTITVRPLLM